MGQHKVPHGENGTMTQRTGKTDRYDGKHREGTAKGSSGQQSRTAGSDVPPRDGTERRDR